MTSAVAHAIPNGSPVTKQMSPGHASKVSSVIEPVTSHATAQDHVCTEGLRDGIELNDLDGPLGDDGAIAVIGMAVKFPGDATSPESFWHMLINRQSALSEVPKSRFNIDAFHNDGSNHEPGTVSYHNVCALASIADVASQINARGGHFVKEDLQIFDASFFSISPAEAECLDPQQRWLLETTYHALENGESPLDQMWQHGYQH